MYVYMYVYVWHIRLYMYIHICIFLYLYNASPAELSLWLSQRREGERDVKVVGAGNFSTVFFFLKKRVRRGIPVNHQQLHIWSGHVGCDFYERFLHFIKGTLRAWVRINVVSWGERHRIFKYVRATVSEDQITRGKEDGRVVNPSRVGLLEFKKLRIVCRWQNIDNFCLIYNRSLGSYVVFLRNCPQSRLHDL